MGIEQELFGIKNRPEGQEFKVIERADGSIAVLAGEKVLVDSGVTPVTAVPSGAGLEPRGIAPSGTVAADGTITLGTALPIAFPQIMLYLPAGAISGGSAGFYFVEMSSSTLGVVRDKFGGSALIGSGSAYSGVVAETEMTRSVVSWGEIASGRNTRLRVQGLCNNTAGTKTYRARVGSIVGTQITSAGPVSNKGFAPEIAVRGVGSSFILGGASGVTGGTNSVELLAVTPGQDVVVVHSLQLSAATDWALIVDVGQVVE